MLEPESRAALDALLVVELLSADRRLLVGDSGTPAGLLRFADWQAAGNDVGVVKEEKSKATEAVWDAAGVISDVADEKEDACEWVGVATIGIVTRGVLAGVIGWRATGAGALVSG